MKLSTWMRKNYESVQGHYIFDALMLAKDDGIAVRHGTQITNAFNAETKRREAVRAKFRRKGAVAA